jgi:putative tryptophan/tyrosine transport system substrate-binding protein
MRHLTRTFLAGIALGVCSSSGQPSWAQSASKVPRIGLFSPGNADATLVSGFRTGLRELGYIEGDIKVEYRWAEGRFETLPQLASELMNLQVDVIVAVVTAASLAAQAATDKVPIVMVGVGDPVGVGLVASLARPGGNITGTSTVQADMVGKHFELVREIEPTITRVGVLWNPANAAFQALQVDQVHAASRNFQVEARLFGVASQNDFESAFRAMSDAGIRVVIILGDPLFALHRVALAKLAREHGLIAVCSHHDLAEAGCLASYAASFFEAGRRAAVYVDKILKGTRPADLPVEQPTRFHLVINLKTAKALNLAIPPTLLARADEVIE